ncbi:Transcriptional family [Hyella patelloides LEGE 07179]|uniref:Transcriptional family n=1 Tax=Hyella patelloides LEGE 07179 TaxID=945734 RepID=A0A563W3S4_9CYAN|nr:AraC family transcriptional regulator [Hyella patelloides]VEP18297.1 Transcriptional family [Hyella patelloides LEGE 07179]
MPISSRRGVLALTIEDIKELQAQAEQQGELIYQKTELGIQENLPRKLGEAGIRIIQIRGGLTICIGSGQLWQTLNLERHHGRTFPVVAKFYLSGSCRVKTSGVSEIEPDYEEVAGYNYLDHLSSMTKFEQWRSNAPLQIVEIYANVDYFCNFSTTKNTLPRPLQILMQDSERFHQSLGKITPAMVQVLQQILHCPYQGSTQQLYLESKALELLTLQFACLEADSPTSSQRPLNPSDLERVQYARDILVKHLNNPPSLTELTHQVGLSDRKLKQGFRFLFGTTVFGYLRDYRMKQAQYLLHSHHITVAQIANQVGYRNPEAFSTAFRRKFGVSPKAYQLGRWV